MILGLQVHETAPDADELMIGRIQKSRMMLLLEQAAAALAAVENETGRTTDPVRMYMREMGTVDLLTREGEIEIAKRIEEGMRDLLAASVAYPNNSGAHVIDYHQMVKDGEKKTNDLLTGFLRRDGRGSICRTRKSKSERCKQLLQKSQTMRRHHGPDMEEVQRRMTNLKRQYNKTLKVIESKRASALKKLNAEYEETWRNFPIPKIQPKNV